MVACLLGLGSNQGDRVGNLLAALQLLREQPGISVTAVSSFVETAPVGGPPGQEKFFNGAAVVESTLSASDLLQVLLIVERKLGRERRERWGPRTIDLDLLLYGDKVIAQTTVTVPHPRMHERRFVLEPAVEIAGHWKHPLRQKRLAELLGELPHSAADKLGMRVYTSPTAMQAVVAGLRSDGVRVGLVPTMGALHEGHLSLVRAARERADIVVTTIFVNPTQFGPSEDLSRYPRTLDQDLKLLSAEGCNFVFLPTSSDMYPAGFSTYVDPPAVAEPLEGKCRPGHFRGVATIVLKLFNLIPADFACFGQKDFQQLLVIRHMVQDLSLPIEIVACPIVRESDGLAMSSRNRYLSPAEREQALALSRALNRAVDLVASGERNATMVVSQMQQVLATAGVTRIDYVTIADPETLAEKQVLDGPSVALIAAFVGKTRLIDNRMLGRVGPDRAAVAGPPQ
jgi:pantoate--beta-alanine ligase